MARIPEELVDYMESGVSLLVGTRDANLRPEATRAVGLRVEKNREHLSVFLSEATSSRALVNIADNGMVALAFSRIFDNHSIQVKGDTAVVRPATDDERALLERYRAAYVEQLYMVGLPRGLTIRLNVWPAQMVTFHVLDLFVQTPGPRAGERIETP